MRTHVLLPAVVLGFALLGCVPSEPPPQIPYGPPAGPAIPGPVPPPAPSASGGAATPIAPAAAAAATPILLGLGQVEAPGAPPDGPPFAGQFLEGQTLEQPINVQAGKCYTIVAAGVGVQLDLQLVTQAAPMLPAVVVAQSQGAGPTATVGGRVAGCIKNPLPIGGPAKVILRAARGSGVAVAQVYAR